MIIGIPCYEDTDGARKTCLSIQATSNAEVLVAASTGSVVVNRNAILRVCKDTNEQYIGFSDDDVEFLPGWEEEIIKAFSYTERVGQVGPLCLQPDGKVWSAWVDFKPNCEPYQAGYGMDVCEAVEQIGVAPALTGCVSVFSRDFLDSIDWRFDERYEVSQFEDVDQSLTVRDCGFAPVYCGKAKIIHHFTPKEGDKSFINRNYSRYLNKWGAWLTNADTARRNDAGDPTPPNPVTQ